MWLKVGPLSNRLFDAADAFSALNHTHADVLAALAPRDGAAAGHAGERAPFVAGQYLRAGPAAQCR